MYFKNKRCKKSIGLLLFLCCFSLIAYPQKKSPDAGYHFISGGDYVQSKNYYLLTLFQQLPAVKQLLGHDQVLVDLAKQKHDSLQPALKNCDRNGACYLGKMKFSARDISVVSERLAALYQPQNALGKLVANHLVPSGAYILYQDLPAAEMLVKAWQQDAAGINFCIDVYAGGSKPNYPLIDSISFSTKDPANNNLYRPGYVSLLYNTVSLVASGDASNRSFYADPLNFSLRFLEMNEREQAADFEPMEKGENKAAFDKIKSTQWNKYKYSVILVPGAGPDDPAMPLSAEGMLRCRLAAMQYKNGVAPFIVVSGGRVHPYKTRYCEATEMKKYLVEKLQVTASAILIDPHARHTTTNMRNVARMIYRYGMPFNKPGITCTTRGQSMMIGTTLVARCIKELNEAPYKNGLRLSETEIEFYPLIEALQINPYEPMDP